MTQEQKDLLIKDLCARLPYGVTLNCCDSIGEKLVSIEENGLINHDYDIDEVRPFLFPLSSMTEEQVYYIYEHYTDTSIYEFDEFYKKFLRGKDDINILFTSCSFLIDYLNKNHFDYRGLIEKSLALDATNLGIYE